MAAWRLIGIERLARLIAALPPAPAGWVRKAQQLPAQTAASPDREREFAIDAHGSAILTGEVAVERAITTVVTRQQVLDALRLEQGTAELRLEQDGQELEENEVEAHKHAFPAADEGDDDGSDEVEAHQRLRAKFDTP